MAFVASAIRVRRLPFSRLTVVRSPLLVQQRRLSIFGFLRKLTVNTGNDNAQAAQSPQQVESQPSQGQGEQATKEPSGEPSSDKPEKAPSPENASSSPSTGQAQPEVLEQGQVDKGTKKVESSESQQAEPETSPKKPEISTAKPAEKPKDTVPTAAKQQETQKTGPTSGLDKPVAKAEQATKKDESTEKDKWDTKKIQKFSPAESSKPAEPAASSKPLRKEEGPKADERQKSDSNAAFNKPAQSPAPAQPSVQAKTPPAAQATQNPKPGDFIKKTPIRFLGKVEPGQGKPIQAASNVQFSNGKMAKPPSESPAPSKQAQGANTRKSPSVQTMYASALHEQAEIDSLYESIGFARKDKMMGTFGAGKPAESGASSDKSGNAPKEAQKPPSSSAKSSPANAASARAQATSQPSQAPQQSSVKQGRYAPTGLAVVLPNIRALEAVPVEPIPILRIGPYHTGAPSNAGAKESAAQQKVQSEKSEPQSNSSKPDEPSKGKTEKVEESQKAEVQATQPETKPKGIVKQGLGKLFNTFAQLATGSGKPMSAPASEPSKGEKAGEIAGKDAPKNEAGEGTGKDTTAEVAPGEKEEAKTPAADASSPAESGAEGVKDTSAVSEPAKETVPEDGAARKATEEAKAEDVKVEDGKAEEADTSKAQTPETETPEKPAEPARSLTKAERRAARRAEKAKLAAEARARHEERLKEKKEEAVRKQAEKEAQREEQRAIEMAALEKAAREANEDQPSTPTDKPADAAVAEKDSKAPEDSLEAAIAERERKEAEKRAEKEKAKAEKERARAEQAKADREKAEKAKAEQAAIARAKSEEAKLKKEQVEKEKAERRRIKAEQVEAQLAMAAKQKSKPEPEPEDVDFPLWGRDTESSVTGSSAQPLKYYAVKVGMSPGIYYSWGECKAQTVAHPAPEYMECDSLVEADAFMRGVKPAAPAAPEAPVTPASSRERAPSSDYKKFTPIVKYYAVQHGKVPGVYTSWSEAREQVMDYEAPVYRKFDTFEEAETFVKKNENYVSPSEAADEASSLPRVEEPQSAGDIAYQFQSESRNNVVEIVTPAFTLRVSPRNLGTAAPAYPEVAEKPTPVAETAAAKPLRPTSYTLPADRVESPTGKGKVTCVYTDGACSDNGKLHGKAGIGVYFGPGDIRNVSEPLPGNRQTSARAELAAIARALEIVRRDFNVKVCTDSQYAVNCLSQWYVGWQRNNWTTSDGRTVENKDIIQYVLQKIEEREKLSASTEFEWVRGHDRSAWNMRADRLAVEGVRKASQLT